MPVLKLHTYWKELVTFSFTTKQLLTLKTQLKDGGGIPQKYYIDTPLNEIVARINEAVIDDIK